jgi:hypothetical protein
LKNNCEQTPWYQILFMIKLVKFNDNIKKVSMWILIIADS